jgi:hypothetical protein
MLPFFSPPRCYFAYFVLFVHVLHLSGFICVLICHRLETNRPWQPHKNHRYSASSFRQTNPPTQNLFAISSIMSFELESPPGSVSHALVVFEVLLFIILLPVRIIIFILEQIGVLGKFSYPSPEEVFVHPPLPSPQLPIHIPTSPDFVV